MNPFSPENTFLKSIPTPTQENFLIKHKLTLESLLYRAIRATDIVKNNKEEYYILPHRSNPVTVFDHYNNDATMRSSDLAQPGLNATEKQESLYANRKNYNISVAFKIKDIFSLKGDIYKDKGSEELSYYITVPEGVLVPCVLVRGEVWQAKVGIKLKELLNNSWVASTFLNLTNEKKEKKELTYDLEHEDGKEIKKIGSIKVEIEGSDLKIIEYHNIENLTEIQKESLLLYVISIWPEIKTITLVDGAKINREELVAKFLNTNNLI